MADLATQLVASNNERDRKRGAALFQQAAKKGHAYSCSQLARFYLTGIHGFPQSPEKAIEWMEKAADNSTHDAALYESYRNDLSEMQTRIRDRMTTGKGGH